LEDRFANTLKVLGDFVVPNAQHDESLFAQIAVARLVLSGTVVLAPIDLDDQFRRKANKVREVRPDRDLSPETKASELLDAQLQPKQALGIGRVPS
jgi:hypothetical protein